MPVHGGKGITEGRYVARRVRSRWVFALALAVLGTAVAQDSPAEADADVDLEAMFQEMAGELDRQGEESKRRIEQLDARIDELNRKQEQIRADTERRDAHNKQLQAITDSVAYLHATLLNRPANAPLSTGERQHSLAALEVLERVVREQPELLSDEQLGVTRLLIGFSRQALGVGN